MAFLSSVASTLEAVYQNDYELDLQWEWGWDDTAQDEDFEGTLGPAPSPTPLPTFSRIGMLLSGTGSRRGSIFGRRAGQEGTFQTVGRSDPSTLHPDHASPPHSQGRRTSILTRPALSNVPPFQVEMHDQNEAIGSEITGKDNENAGKQSLLPPAPALVVPSPGSPKRSPGRRVSILPPTAADMQQISSAGLISSASSQMVFGGPSRLSRSQSDAWRPRSPVNSGLYGSRGPSTFRRDLTESRRLSGYPASRRTSFAPSVRSHISKGGRSVRTVVQPPEPVSNLATVLVVLGSFFAQFCAIGVLNCYPTFQARYVAEFAPGITPTYFSFVGAVCNALIGIVAPFVGSAIAVFGPRLVCAAGGLVMAAGLALSALAVNTRSVGVIMVGHGLMVGIGAGMVIVPSATVAPQYSTKYRGLISGITSAGGGVGGLVLVPFTSVVIEALGPSWALVAQGVIVAVTVLGAAVLLRPRYLTTERDPMNLRSVASDPTLWLVALSAFFIGAGQYIPSFYLYGLIPGAQSVSQVFWGLASHRLGYANCVLLSVILASMSCFGVWLPWEGSVVGIIVFSVCWGLSTGGARLVALQKAIYDTYALPPQFFSIGMLALLPIALLELFSFESWELRVGIVLFGNALGTLAGPPIGSVIVGTTRKWTWLEVFVGVTWSVGAVTFGTVAFWVWRGRTALARKAAQLQKTTVEQAPGYSPNQDMQGMSPSPFTSVSSIESWSKELPEDTNFIRLIILFIENELEAHNESIQNLLADRTQSKMPPSEPREPSIIHMGSEIRKNEPLRTISSSNLGRRSTVSDLLLVYKPPAGDLARAIDRRMNVRAEHLSRMEKAKADGIFIGGGAILSESEKFQGKPKMIGSMVLVKHENVQKVREFFNALRRSPQDPYVEGRVWESFDVHPFRLAETGFYMQNL
ncbi:hypothetical protein HDU93_007106 [Gonapodya sp. JEL0774]|nr:hypothetical protein HDU93_007106 [Gonapodya sp. JEL0774]